MYLGRGGGFAIFHRVGKGTILRNMTFEQKLKEVKERTTWIFGGRAFQ